MAAEKGTIKDIGENANRVRMTIDLSQRLNGVIDRIAEANDSTKADVMRLAIEFLEAGMKAKDAGMNVGGWSVDGNGVRHERVFVGI